MRTIDADALMQKYCGACSNKEFCAEQSCKYYEFRWRIETSPTIPEIDRAAILRLCNEIEDIVIEIHKLSSSYLIDTDCRFIRNMLKAIGKELTGDAGTD